MFQNQSLFACPQCRRPLDLQSRCSCGFAPEQSNGILNFMTPDEIDAAESFLEAYERVRNDEKWGDDDLDLPFHPRRHLPIWNIRQRTFRKFETLAAKVERGVALDIGAGNCWMTRYLAQWGFDAVAVDINTSRTDGLEAGDEFIRAGARFLRVRAGMERLPFASERIKLIAANASFHYASDFRAALSELERVLTPGGFIVIIDTPFYKDAADGEIMISERVCAFRQKYGIAEALASRARYLTFDGFKQLVRSTDLRGRLHPVWPGWRRKYEEIRGIVAGRRIAGFPVAVLEKREK